MIAPSSTEAALRRIIAAVAKVDPDSFARDDDLRSTLGLDSLSALRIAAAVEREFDVRIPDNELHTLTTVAKIVEVLEGNLKSGI